MEQASLTTDNLRNTMATVDAMKTANKELRKQYGKIDVDKIEVRLSSRSLGSSSRLVERELTQGTLAFALACPQQMQYDMEDLIEQANEVQESMSRSYGVPDELDEIDLDAGPSAPLPLSPSTGHRNELTHHAARRARSPRGRLCRRVGAGHPVVPARRRRGDERPARLCRRRARALRGASSLPHFLSALLSLFFLSPRSRACAGKNGR